MRTASAIETVPEPCQVAGTPLRPFCLGHHLLFKRLGLPFAGSALADAGEADIVAGIVICAGASYERTLEGMMSGEWGGIVRRWRRRQRKVTLWRKRALYWHDAEMLFRAYLQAGYEPVPVRRYESAAGLEMSAPWEELLKCRLVMAGFEESAVLNKYLPAAWYDYYTVSEFLQAANCKDVRNWRKVFWNAVREDSTTDEH